VKAERSAVITLVASLALLWVLLAGCLAQGHEAASADPGRPSIPASHADGGSGTVEPITSLAATPTLTSYLPLVTRGHAPGVIMPSDLTYEGAFRLPGPDDSGWGWGGSALTYYPDGDGGSGGPSDGYPGSLFGVGHDHTQYVSEVSIPVPVISAGKDVNDLNTATTLQDFVNVRGSLYDRYYWEIPRAGLAYLPAQGTQAAGKLHFCWGVHMQELDDGPTHGWCELDLSAPQPKGAWRMGGFLNYVTADYMFDIPQAWAEAYVPGMYLATGRFRDGGQGGEGPSLIAYAPYGTDSPPAAGSTIPAVPLLLYGSVYQPAPPAMDGYHHSDEWSGGAWLTAGNRAAVIFAGTKGQGDCWYGCKDGTVWPEEPPFPPDCPERGWWSTSFVGQILFYDPADLADVALGNKQSYEPQPHAVWEIDDYLYHLTSDQEWFHVGAIAFDRGRGLLYVVEPFADGDKPIVHVWRVG
jgi:hypothetical protein